MAEYDGSIRIGTEITTKEAEKELKNLESSISKTAEKIASLRSKMDALKDTKIPTQEYGEISAQIEKAEQKFNKLLEKQEQMQREGKDNGVAWERINYQIEEVGNEIRYAKGELQDLVNTGKAFTLGSNTDKYAQMVAQMQQLNQQIQSDTQRQSELQSALAAEEERLVGIKANATVSDQHIIDLLEQRKQLIQEIADMEKAGSGLGYQQYEYANQELKQINDQIKEYKDNLTRIPEKFSNMQKSAKMAFNSVNSGAKTSSGFISAFVNRIKGLAASAFIFNLISNGFNAVISGAKKGFENLTNYSKSYVQSIQNLKNALSALGNQFSAAFSPIIQAVIPWLTNLINVISTAIEYASRFFAILTGKSSYTRAKKAQDSYISSLGGTAKKEEDVGKNADDMSDSLDDAAKSAKKAKGALAAFDDLDVLEKQDENTDNTALDGIKDIKNAVDDLGGVGGGLGDLFEEVPIDNELPEWLEKILDYFKMLKDIFEEGFWDGLGDWEYRWDIIKDGIEKIRKALIDIWTDPAVLGAADTWLKSLMYMLGSLVGSVASIGLTTAAAFIGGLGEYMENNVDRIKSFLISAFNIGSEINYLLADLFQSVAYIFEAFASESGIRFMAALIGSVADTSMGLIELALRLGRDFLRVLILPITENKDAFRQALEGMLNSIAIVLEGFKKSIDTIFDKLFSVYDSKVKPFFDSIAKGLSEIVGTFLDAWNGNIIPMLERVGEKFSEVLTDYITPFVNSVIEFVGNIATILQSFWESFLMPFVEWIITYAVPVISVIIEVLVNSVIIAVESILAILTELMNIVNNVLIPIWQGAWDKAGKFFQVFFDLLNRISSAIKELITGLFKSIAFLVQGDWKSAWENAKKIFETFKEKVGDVIGVVRGILESFFEWVSELVSGVLGLIGSIGSAISGAASSFGSFAGGIFGGGKSSSPAITDSYATPDITLLMKNIPHLASGSVIRGGNPFLAILGDQPVGKTNIEAPLSTIEKAVENAMSRREYGIESVPVNINLNYDGETFARLSISDILSELGRQGYNVDVLGVT